VRHAARMAAVVLLTACAPPSAGTPGTDAPAGPAERAGWRSLSGNELELCRRDFAAFSPARAIPACECVVNRIERAFTLAELIAFQAKLNAAPDRAARNDVTLSDPKMGAVIRTCSAVLFRDNSSGSDTVSLPTEFRPSARVPPR
jgi:hypothetical protein